MRKYHAVVPNAILAIICGCLLVLMPRAQAQTLVQVTNPPPTILESFESQTGTIIVKGFSQIGTVPVGNSAISVRAKEDNDVSHGQKVYGLTITFNGSGSSSEPGNLIPKTSLVVDYDELDSLISGIDYVSKVTWGVTQLNGFEAVLTTKSGFSVIAHSDRRQGAIATYLQFQNRARIALDSDHLAQFRNLLVQAKATLDGLK